MFDIRVFNALAAQTSMKIGQLSFNVTTPSAANAGAVTTNRRPATIEVPRILDIMGFLLGGRVSVFPRAAEVAPRLLQPDVRPNFKAQRRTVS